MTCAIRRVCRLLVSLAIAISGASLSFAQLSGSYTIGGTSPDFPTFSTAISALTTNGVSGPVNFMVRNGTYVEQVTVGPVSGASSSNAITFEAEGGNPDSVVLMFNTTSLTDNYVLRLNQTAHIRLRNMSFMSVASGTAGGVVRLEGAVSDILLTGNTFTGYASLSSGTAFALLYALDANLSSILVQGNIFNDCSLAISLKGLTTALASDILIVNNIINNVNGYGGVFLNLQDAPIVYGNLIFAGNVGVELDNCDNALRVSANIIEAKRQGVVIYSCAGTSSNAGLVDDNFIHITGTGAVEGVRMQLSENQSLIFNSINMTGTSSSGAAISLIQGSGNSVDVVNNILVNTGGGYSYSATTSGAVGTSDYNDMITTGPYIASWNSTNVPTVSALQTLSGKDMHSITHAVHFVSNLDLHLTGASLGDPELRGIFVDSTFRDIDGENRFSPYPYIGADEATTSPLAVREAALELPLQSLLEQNYPNPFNPSTVIGYTVGGTRGQGLALSDPAEGGRVEGSGVSMVRLSVYDLLGREVAVLVDGLQEAGRHEVRFDATGLASGVYLYRLQAGNTSLSKAMVLVR